jgi:hypothetical protein
MMIAEYRFPQAAPALWWLENGPDSTVPRNIARHRCEMVPDLRRVDSSKKSAILSRSARV